MHLFPTILCSAAAFTCIGATTLFAASYNGNITTLNLTYQSQRYSLEAVSTNSDCAQNATWLTLDHPHGVLYCLNEGLSSTNGSLNSFTVNPDGSLNLIQQAQTYGGPVNGLIYGDPIQQRAIALAHYAVADGAVSNFVLNSTLGGFAYNQLIELPLNQTGPNPDGRQAKPHAHEAILDPTGAFVLVPDLGADFVRVFAINSSTLALNEQTPLSITAGRGPRHAVFYQPHGLTSPSTYLFVVTEIGNTVESYNVTYPATGGLNFTKVWESNVFGNASSQPVGNAPAEIAISPDNRFLLISNRNDTASLAPNSTVNGSAPSDFITTFALRHCGSPIYVGQSPVGGLWPRHFSMNKYGNLVAVGLQWSQQAVILERNVVNGSIGNVVAQVDIPGNVTGVWWWE